MGLVGRTAVVVDDGLATGYTARAAVAVARKRRAAAVVLAVPVAAPETASELGGLVDRVVCMEMPSALFAVGAAYQDFGQTGDAEVERLLATAAARAAAEEAPEVEVFVEADGVVLPGVLAVPLAACGVVLFAHGSGSSRRSPRNLMVASMLRRAGLATLMFDLLTGEEGGNRSAVFDIPLLGARLGGATRWLRGREGGVGGLPYGYFGASTGAAAALWAASDEGDAIRAVVGRGGRPDLAGPRLGRVTAPTLLIVGERDPMVLSLNREASDAMTCERRLEVVPGATHLFEEPGTLEQASVLARDWFLRWLA
jgi:putative phosphoribosyl transferase